MLLCVCVCFVFRPFLHNFMTSRATTRERENGVCAFYGSPFTMTTRRARKTEVTKYLLSVVFRGLEMRDAG